MKAIVSQKGQVTVPKECRERLGLKAGTALEFEARDGLLIGRKIQPAEVFRKWRGRGRLPGAVSVDDYLARTRG